MMSNYIQQKTTEYNTGICIIAFVTLCNIKTYARTGLFRQHMRRHDIDILFQKGDYRETPWVLWRHYRETPWVRWCAEGDQLGGSSGQRLRPQAVAVTAWSTQLISRSVPQHEGGFPFIPYFKTFKNCTTNNKKRCFIGTKINYVIHLLHYVIHHERSRSSVSRALLRDTGISTG